MGRVVRGGGLRALGAKAHPIDTGEEVLAAAADHGLMNVKKMWDL